MRVEGGQQVADWLGEIAGRLRDPAPALEREAEAINRMVGASFADRRSPDGVPWPARRQTTARTGRAARPRAAGRSGSGRLQAETDARVDDGVLVVESRAPYAGYVQDRRAFLPFDAALEPTAALDGMTGRIADWIVGGR